MFLPGQPRPEAGGRKKGTPNKVNGVVMAKLQEMGCDPIEGMALIAMDEAAPQDLRAKMYAELAQYCYPKRRAVEHSSPGSDALRIEVEYLDANDPD